MSQLLRKITAAWLLGLACLSPARAEPGAEAVCQNITVSLDANGQYVIDPHALDGGSTAPGGIASWTASPSVLTCANLGTNLVILSIVSSNGSDDSCTAQVVVQDTTPPVALCQDLILQMTSVSVTVTPAQVDGGSFDNCAIVSRTLTPNVFTCAELGTNPVELVVTDSGGNSATCTAFVTVQDLAPPTVVCQNLTLGLPPGGPAVITPAQVDNGSFDGCGIATLTVSRDTFTCADLGTNLVDLVATDLNGNSATCTALVVVQDVTPPSVFCRNLVADLGTNGTVTITGEQLDDGSVDDCTIQARAAVPGLFTCADLGSNQVSLIVTDQSGNSSTCTAVVTVRDVTPPVVACQGLVVNLGAEGVVAITPAEVDAGSYDVGCGIASLVLSTSSFTCADLGTNLVRLIATDLGGNSSTCTAQVVVRDVTPPTALCRNINLPLAANGQATLLPAQVDDGSFDGCGIQGMSVSPSSFACADLGPQQVELVVTDFQGNSSTCTATVTVQDVTPPVVVTRDLTVDLDADGLGNLTAGQVENGSSDQCGILSLQVIPSSFSCADTGTNIVDLVVTDVGGNAATGHAQVIVRDTTTPRAVCRDITVDLGPAGTVTVPGFLLDDGSSDNCSIAAYHVTPSNFTCADLGPVPVTFSVTDASGNPSSNRSAVITIRDATPPAISSCPATTIEVVGPGGSTVVPDFTNQVVAADACTGILVAQAPPAGTVVEAGTHPIALTVSDFNGNTSTCITDFVVAETFSGFRMVQAGSWTNPANWLGGLIPANPLPTGDSILIAPTNGAALLDFVQILSPGSEMFVSAKFFGGTNQSALRLASNAGIENYGTLRVSGLVERAASASNTWLFNAGTVLISDSAGGGPGRKAVALSSITNEAGGALDIGPDGQLAAPLVHNKAGAVLFLQPGGSLSCSERFLNSGAVTNRGLVRFSGLDAATNVLGASFESDGVLVNQGTVSGCGSYSQQEAVVTGTFAPVGTGLVYRGAFAPSPAATTRVTFAQNAATNLTVGRIDSEFVTTMQGALVVTGRFPVPPALDDEFYLVTAPLLSGTFSSTNLNLDLGDPALAPAIVYHGFAVVLRIVPAPLPPQLLADTPSVFAGEGDTAFNSGTFFDAEGNGTVSLSASSGLLVTNALSGTWSWSGTAGDGPAGTNIVISASDDQGHSTNIFFTLFTSNLPPVLAAMEDIVVPDAQLDLVVSFSDPGPDVWSATVDYGDGTGIRTSTVNQAGMEIPLSHLYLASGQYTVTVTLADGDLGGTVAGSFAASVNLALHGVSPAWLAGHGLAADDETVLADPDNDRMPTWMEYFAGTDPTNGLSYLDASPWTRVAGTNDFALIQWQSATGRLYHIESATGLTEQNWTGLAGATGLPATPPLNVYTVRVDQVGQTNAALRLRVEFRPP